ncbi:Asp-tRNA(Asn)/Glu-tRNA(Gln) amidotransferase subunit GatB [Candidatus Woesearchaeota archaeon]|jgi:aspartyl-tRNA(Asn)/glutamyl-tRNA(Gln) amidotransferase subunit B|nr:Asp-tRNA(Asn)/Glu-tRNA(Gln) amidotransferase subunit GatB [Candidatus Woesearchaeota archaeon]
MKFTTPIVIGLEIHLQLATKTKLFCSCPCQPEKKTTNSDNKENPNTRTCPICLGHPGSKPVFNKKVLEFSTKLALALNCNISKNLIFSRKSYFYPDLAKNYQITQYELPLGENGFLQLPNGKKIGITRVHIEEDPASLIHQGSIDTSSFTLVDYNRSGNPLCEIVTEPDIQSPEEARDFLNALIAIVKYLNIFNSENCIVKADANISIKESGYVRSEVKNISGFKEIERALFYEVDRQKNAFEKKEAFVQDTRAWDSNKGLTFRMRTKETEADYGYILDPDLVAIPLTDEYINKIKSKLPELPFEKSKKFVNDFKINKEDAHILAQEKSLAELFEKVATQVDPILAAKWLRHELNKVLNLQNKSLEEIKTDETQIIELLTLVQEKKITDLTGREILEKLIESPFSPTEYVKEHNLESVSDESLIREICEEAIKENPKAIQDFKDGNKKAINSIIGKVMKATKGQASPSKVNEVMEELTK